MGVFRSPHAWLSCDVNARFTSANSRPALAALYRSCCRSPPSLCQQTAVQPGLGSHLRSGLRRRSPRRRAQIPNFQFLHSDPPKPPHDPSAGPVARNAIPHLRSVPQRCQPSRPLAEPPRALLAASRCSLLPPHLGSVRFRRRHHRPVRQRHPHPQPDIDAHRLRRRLQASLLHRHCTVGSPRRKRTASAPTTLPSRRRHN